jgi:hypothetical protein
MCVSGDTKARELPRPSTLTASIEAVDCVGFPPVFTVTEDSGEVLERRNRQPLFRPVSGSGLARHPGAELTG